MTPLDATVLTANRPDLRCGALRHHQPGDLIGDHFSALPLNSGNRTSAVSRALSTHPAEITVSIWENPLRDVHPPATDGARRAVIIHTRAPMSQADVVAPVASRRGRRRFARHLDRRGAAR